MTISRNSWWEEDVLEKSKILTALWEKLVKIKPEDIKGIKYKNLIEFIASCRHQLTPIQVEEFFIEVSRGNKNIEEFKQFFDWLSPLDAKPIARNHAPELIRINSAAMQLTDNNLIKLNNYLSEAKTSEGANLSATTTLANQTRMITAHSPNIHASVPFAIHSVQKIFTGLLALMTIPGLKFNDPIKDLISENAWNQLPKNLQKHLDTNEVTLTQLITHHGGIGDYGYDKPTKCDLLVLSSPPQKGNLNNLPIISDTAYVRTGNEIYYIDKAKNTCEQLKVDNEVVKQFDAKLQNEEKLAVNNHRTLSYAELRYISSITNHNHLKGYYRAEIEEFKDGHGSIPKIDQIQDFLRFAEEQTYEVNKFHYSNLGITLVGLAIEETYRKMNPEISPPLSFYEILYKFILEKAGIDRSQFTANMPEVGRFNPSDPIAANWVGGPAGGYWTTTEVLTKLAQSLFNNLKSEPDLLSLVKYYGSGEFYFEIGKQEFIMHAGESPSSSAFLSVCLNTGDSVAVLSDLPGMASSIGLELMAGNKLNSLMPTKDLKDDLNANEKHSNSSQRGSTAFIIGSGITYDNRHSSRPEVSAYPLANKNNIDRAGKKENLEDKNPELDAGIFHPTPFSKRPQPKG